MPLTHRGYGAYVSCDGKEVRIHNPGVEKDQFTMSGYIVSEAGMELKVHWVDSEPPSHLSVEIRMDGRRICVVSHCKGSAKTSSAGFRVPMDAIELYRFSPLTTHDGHDLPSAYTEKLGTIEVMLRRVIDFVPVAYTPARRAHKPGGSVQESKTKGRCSSNHCVSHGRNRQVKANSTILKPILIDDKPYVIFRFNYRPRDFLESSGIIRGLSPSSAATAIDSSKSLAYKRQRSQSEGPLAPMIFKKQRIPFENDDTPIPHLSKQAAEADDDEDTTISIEMVRDILEVGDHNDNEVEVRPSSKDSYAIPRDKEETAITNEWFSHMKKPLSVVGAWVKREHSPPPLEESMPPVKREPLPVPQKPIVPSTKPSVTVKNQSLLSQSLPYSAVKKEPSSPKRLLKRHSSQNIRSISCEDGVATKIEPHMNNETWNEDEETLVEIHISSRNQHLVFGAPFAMKDEERCIY